MKPKFHPGDRVTVIKPYVAPIPGFITHKNTKQDAA